MKYSGKTIFGFLATYLIYLLICRSGFYYFCDKFCIDKIFHLTGGYLIAALFADLSRKNNILILLILTLTLGSAWEFLEVFFLSPFTFPDISLIKTAHFSFGDVAADMGGCLLYILTRSLKIVSSEGGMAKIYSSDQPL